MCSKKVSHSRGNHEHGEDPEYPGGGVNLLDQPGQNQEQREAQPAEEYHEGG